MANVVELRARLDFWQKALEKLRVAYLKLLDGGVKSYRIDDRELTRLTFRSSRRRSSRRRRKWMS